MTYRYSIDGERIEDDDEGDRSTGIDECKAALTAAAARRLCPVCGGQLKPGWLIHTTCRAAS